MKVTFLKTNILPKKNQRTQDIQFEARLSPNNGKLSILKKDVFNHSETYYGSLLEKAKKELPLFGKNIPIINFEINGKNIIGEYFADGAIKAVYNFNEYGKKNVICLPSSLSRDISKWSEVFVEPRNTKDIKNLGLLANDYCEIQPIKINNTIFPALKMKHYDEHNFKIYDCKTFGDDAPNLNEMIDLSEISDRQLADIFEGVSNDINTLVKNDVHLFSDSFCFARTNNNKLRLYFHDLGGIPSDNFNNSIWSSNSMNLAEKTANAESIISNIGYIFSYSFRDYSAACKKEKNLIKILKERIDI